jgi:hypothetical protein
MTEVQGIAKKITKHVLKTLDGKICMKLSEILTRKVEDMSLVGLSYIFSPDTDKPEGSYKDKIYEIYRDQIVKELKEETQKQLENVKLAAQATQSRPPEPVTADAATKKPKQIGKSKKSPIESSNGMDFDRVGLGGSGKRPPPPSTRKRRQRPGATRKHTRVM